MFRWVIPDTLLRGQRPGYHGEKGAPVPQPDVDAWLQAAKSLGVRSIICLLADDQLPLYASLPGGLLAHYRSAGFETAHVPARDHAYPPLTASHLEQVWKAFVGLPKPVLVHCSAGVDRTGQAVQHIQQQLKRGDGR